MILYLKHLVFMSLALFTVPLIARSYARLAGSRRRFKRPGVTWAIVVAQFGIAIAVPLLAQGLFSWLGNRWLALTIAGALYGAMFGDDQDFPLIPSVAWGILGGLAAWYCYASLAISSEARALCVALFAVAPLLAYRPVAVSIRRQVGSGGVITPSRRILR